MFNSETDFEIHIRALISKQICAKKNTIQMLDNKDVVDILVCKNSKHPTLFFIEAKFYKQTSGRIGFGNGQGGGFQPEILLKRPRYFEKNMRWIFGKQDDSGYYVLTNDEACKYLCGGNIGVKFNNFQKKLFAETEAFDDKTLVEYLTAWFN